MKHFWRRFHSEENENEKNIKVHDRLNSPMPCLLPHFGVLCSYDYLGFAAIMCSEMSIVLSLGYGEMAFLLASQWFIYA
jgi:hypothetical protein